ncbi:carboxylesterase/lipase family protein [Sunxiuqinia sp. A32]|uniref:carboxylesterase/lipase family protein n=1 Tax=Sunxiuqinia sp. A32 TaxID=3461496 RepID=UPI004045C2B2
MTINRRNFFGKAGVGIAACSFGAVAPLTACSTSSISVSDEKLDDQQLFIGENIAVADTVYGKVKGFLLRGIYNFRGIPYGADTSGKNRFLPPQKPEPWTNVRPAVFYGSSSPQDIYDRSPESYGVFVDHWNYDVLSEDCLRLNVWSPALDGKKRPVLVWLHGGGFSRGNGIEQDGYNGENISRSGDVVYVSINHRLGPLGFTDLSSVGGEKFKSSGNVGMLDIISALEWVNANIQNFGGDPGNVTVMGQSGGGSKVCNVATMPAAKGLVHKGVALSGESVRGGNQEYTQKLGEYILKEAGLSSSQINKLQEMPWEKYMDIAYKASSRLQKEGLNIRRGGFGPIADGINIPKGDYFNAEDSSLPDIPMIFCSTFHEWNPDRDNPELENITMDEVAEKIKGSYGDKSKEIVSAYAKQFPEARPIEIWALIASNRRGIVNAADTKLQQKSPVYMAWFGWESPLFDGRHRAFHCIDISFWFLNTDLMITHTGGGARPRTLSAKMADALLNFLRTGDPNCEKLPEWPKYTSESGETMVLDDTCAVKNNPDGEARKHLS